MVAVAGALAEHAWSCSLDQASSDWSVIWADLAMDPAFMSETDWRLARHEPGGEVTRRLEKALDDVWALLRPDRGDLWRPLCETARTLIRHGACEMRPGLAARCMALNPRPP